VIRKLNLLNISSLNNTYENKIISGVMRVINTISKVFF